MGLLSTILDKLGLGSSAHATTPSASPSASAAPTPSSAGAPMAKPVAPPPAAMSSVDVVAKLQGLAQKHAEKLNWKTSIVDLLKLLGIDSSLNARKSLATELNCPADNMGDSAQMNMWLHKALLRKLAENGGNIPKELLD
ncbi:MAG: DUF3597 domain-containing protein [Nitrospira sp.]|nr:MAG: DUF3597 domain-containing protein [Nitrospira sp.]